jgi:hypothetical protein
MRWGGTISWPTAEGAWEPICRNMRGVLNLDTTKPALGLPV